MGKQKEEEEKKDRAALLLQERKKIIYNLVLVVTASFVVLIGVLTMAWFAMNKDTSSSGLGVMVQSGIFELKTSGSAGLYDNYITRVDNGYSNGTQTSPYSSKIILQLTDDYQIENLWEKNTTPTEDDLNRIKRLESTEYGLSPGDHGVIKFSIVPVHAESGSFNVLIKPIISCYKTEYYTTDDTGYTAGYQKDSITVMNPNDAAEGVAIGFTNTHISMYYMADENGDNSDEMHLIQDDGFVVQNITTETYVEIYWFWPEDLNGILAMDIEDMDASGKTELRKEFFAEPEKYLEKISDSDNFSSIVIAKTGTESARDTQALAILDSPNTYNFYSTRYNNADQTIGDKVGYIMVEIVAERAD